MKSAEFLRLVDHISRERGLDKNLIFDQIEHALAQAASKRFNATGEFTISIDRETGEILAFEDEKGWVVVDYKTDEFVSAEAAWQVRLYASVLSRHLRRKSRAFLYFARFDEAMEIDAMDGAPLVERWKQAFVDESFPLHEGERCGRCEHFGRRCPSRFVSS